MLFKSMIINLFNRLHLIFSLIIVLYDMNMDGLMVVRIEHEPKSKEYKYRRHGLPFAAKIQSFPETPNMFLHIYSQRSKKTCTANMAAEQGC